MKLTTYNAICVINSFFVIDAICVIDEKNASPDLCLQ